MSRLLDWARLSRLSNLPTAWSNVLLGFAISGELRQEGTAIAPPLCMLLGISTCMYLGGMVLNDVFDVEQDRRERPGRVLPSGKISVSAARWAGWLLLACGVVLSIATTGILGDRSLFNLAGSVHGLVLVLAIAIVAYDGGGKNTPAGPLLMGICRTLNVLIGAGAGVTGFADFERIDWHVAGAIGLFVAGVTAYARNEHLAGRRRAQVAGAVILFLAVVMIALIPHSASFTDRVSAWLGNRDFDRLRWIFSGMILILLVPTIRHVIRGIRLPVPSAIQQAVVACLQTLIIIDASVCFLFHPDRVWLAAGIAMLVIPRMVLGRLIPST